MPTEVLLVRHGQTASNVTRLYMGWSAVYSSPLKRAATTAGILAEPHHLTVKPVDDLIEIKLGEWEGFA